jgi:hypothetical protein
MAFSLLLDVWLLSSTVHILITKSAKISFWNKTSGSLQTADEIETEEQSDFQNS